MSQETQVGDRIKAFLEAHGLNAYQASQKLGHEKPSKVYKLVNNDAKPGYDTIVELLTAWPDLSPEWLILGTGPMLRGGAAPANDLPLFAAKAPVLPERGISGGRVVAVTVDHTGHENILMVPLRDQAAYAKRHDDPAFLDKLSTFRLPLFASGTFRAFEVDGDELHPGIRRHDVAVCSFVERWDLLAPGSACVVVVPGSVLVRRLPSPITERRQVVELLADNARIAPMHVPAADIIELWQVRGYLTTRVPAPPVRSGGQPADGE
ncbi:helix-turn-helix domain-containing protein [Hymenobacter wooponensis]|uniref:XRE family transcriptional regulator n=1 Tax=Hymenobacter wooponensis TaxID=1525360 RepID=A0A4Z0MPB0_9BACT|nr:helix-turn-helix transcriptional regulator [Hymenobacter wooponensis]TGD81722.1 XRE family transcriptional regulator [Hymenobacter wooponensis]